MKKNGFTLIELLAVILIIGILSITSITAIGYLINRSKIEVDNQNKETIKMATKSYMENHSEEYPKLIGETTDITIQQVKDAGYLKEDIENYKGESCMKNTFTRIKKTTKTKYKSTLYYLCGKETYKEKEDKPKPTTKIYFIDSLGTEMTEYKDILENMEKETLYIKMTGGKDKERGNIKIASYVLYIYEVKDGNQTEIYNSGTLSVEGRTSVTVRKKLSEFIDITTINNFNVRVIVINEEGERIVVDSIKEYYDNKKPFCNGTLGEATSEWINKNDYLSGKLRTITVDCEDIGNSNCIRPQFTRSWPNTLQPTGAEYGYIQIVDNAANTSFGDEYLTDPCNIKNPINTCRVKVLVDVLSPTIEIKQGALKNKVIADNNSENGSVTIKEGDYNNLFDNWMNKENYPNGVTFTVKLSDNLHLASYTWETNEPNLKEIVPDFETVNYQINDEMKTKIYPDQDETKSNCGTRSEDNITIGFVHEGKRQGRLTVVDKAGNVTKVYITAFIDRTPPPVPEPLIYTPAYQFGTWTKETITISIPNDFKTDNISGWDYLKYKDIMASGTTATGKITDSFIFTETFEGKNTIKFRAYDKANNASEYNTPRAVWIDRKNPTCDVKITEHVGRNSAGWSGIDEFVRVKATCKEQESNFESGCYQDNNWETEFSHKYNSNINTTTAGAKGNNQGGKIRDVAGNITNCEANQTVKIDHTKPSCTATKRSSTVNTTAGVIIDYSCADSANSGVKSCPESTDNIQCDGCTITGTVKDKADNTNTCSKIVHKKTQSKYRTATWECLSGSPNECVEWCYESCQGGNCGGPYCVTNHNNVPPTAISEYCNKTSNTCNYGWDWSSWSNWSNDSCNGYTNYHSSKKECKHRDLYY